MQFRTWHHKKNQPRHCPVAKDSTRLLLGTMQHQTAERKQTERKKTKTKTKASVKTDDGLYFPKKKEQGMNDAKNTRLIKFLPYLLDLP